MISALGPFMVGRVLGLVDVDRSEVHPLPPQFRGGERDRLLGHFSNSAYIALITNPFWVLDLRLEESSGCFHPSEPLNAEQNPVIPEAYSTLDRHRRGITSAEAAHAKS